MTIRKNAGALALGALVLTLMGRPPLEAQEPASKSAAPAARKQEPTGRVPRHFGQIALTSDQRTRIYTIQVKRQEKIDALEKQISAEKAGMLAECEGVLSEVQKKLLEDLRRAAAEAPRKPVEPAKAAN